MRCGGSVEAAGGLRFCADEDSDKSSCCTGCHHPGHRRGILALPLIGMIDEHRVATIMETLLSKITGTQSDVVILDVTGVHEIDTYVTGQLIRIVRAVRLLGATCIVTGVRPESAHALVELGVDTSELVTRRTLQDGLRYAQKLTGEVVVDAAEGRN